MSSLSQFVGGSQSPKVIVNASSGGSYAGFGSLNGLASQGACRAVLSGALTANTLATVLSVTGSGEIDILAAYGADTTSRTIRMKVTIDGVSVYDATTAAIASASYGVFVLGGGNNTVGFHGSKVSFKTSLLVQIASSLSETDKITTAYRYFTS